MGEGFQKVPIRILRGFLHLLGGFVFTTSINPNRSKGRTGNLWICQLPASSDLRHVLV